MGNKQYTDKVLLEAIALRIKELRKEKNITQEEFLFDTGIHIGRIERAGRNFSVSTLSQICHYLDIEINSFFDTQEFRK